MIRPRPTPAPHGGTTTSDATPSGAIEVTNRYLVRDGRPWFPITGEIHYSRLARERWDEVLGLARAGGLDTVATYVFWQAHEPRPGEFHWSGNLDLRAFVELAAAHGLDVVVRMGPWTHGEARYGGFPDWLVASGVATRTNDPAYLALVRSLFAEQAAQLAGLTHGEGGPIVALQMDNELYDQPEHLATLRTLAEDAGLHVPIWTATGWGRAQVPDTLLPVYSAYADGFWEETTTEWPAFAVHHYRYDEVRDDLTVGADVREVLDGVALDGVVLDGVVLDGVVPTSGGGAARTTPFATCELGGGMHVAYHRRPLVTPEDVAALALATIGSGSVWQGYYMYAGGTMARGPWGTSQESQATGYPNDVPTRSYDFAAPIGEHGQLRRHFHALRLQHLLLALDGAALAAMPARVGGGSADPNELRWAVRSDSSRGHLFLSTYQPARSPIAAQPGVQVAVELDGETLVVPSRPVDLPAGVSLVWPLRYPLTDSVVLRSATAQLVTRVSDRVSHPDGDDVVVLAATAGVPVTLSLEHDGAVHELDVSPGRDAVVVLPGVRVLVLDEATARTLYRFDVAGAPRLVLTDAAVHVEGETLVLHSDRAEVDVAVFPATDLARDAADYRADDAADYRADDPGASPSERAEEATPSSIWRTYRVPVPGAGTHRIAEALAPVAPHPPAPATGGPMRRLSAPTDFSGAARVPLAITREMIDGVDRVLLRVTWTGDVGRAVVGEEVLSDHFWHGREWDVDLTGHREAVARDGLALELLPWRAATGVWVDPSVRDVPDGIAVDAVDVVRVGRAELDLRPTAPRA